MNPELPRVQSSAEQLPPVPGSIEYQPPGGHEGGMERPAPAPLEQAPTRRHEVQAPPAQAAPPAVAPVGPMVAPPATQGGASQSLVSGDDLPSVASDDDVMEREWVDKAKKIIALTKEDPYERGKAIAELQADYLRKRWGRELGSES